MGYTLVRHGFSRFSSAESGVGSALGLAQQLMQDISRTGGMRKLHPTNEINSSTKIAVFESDTGMDPLADQDQKWRLRIEAGESTSGSGTSAVTHSFIRINLGTNHQIPSDGSSVTRSGETTRSGNLGGPVDAHFDNSSLAMETPFLSGAYFFGDRNQDPASSPMSYRLSVSDHGIALAAWRAGYDSSGDMFAWFVAQRPVDPANGQVLEDDYSPVFCVYSVGGGGSNDYSIPSADLAGILASLEGTTPSFNRSTVTNALRNRQLSPAVRGIRKFVVRETDVQAPTVPRSAVLASEDSNPIINPMEQVSISVDNKYMITFPSGLNTQRRAYKHELDMLAYTSADVIAQDSDVAVTVFGESQPRVYKAMQANMPFNTGMRILLLVEGGGIPPESAP